MPDPRRTPDMDAEEMPRPSGLFLLLGAVKAAEEHVGVRRPDVQHDPATRLQPVLKSQRTDLVGVPAELAAAPEVAADFPCRAAGVVRLAEAEVVRPCRH